MLFTQRPCDPFLISRAATHFRPRVKNKYPPFCGGYLRIRHNMQIDQIKFKFNFIFIPSPKTQAIDWTTPWFSQWLDTEKTTIHYLKQPGMSYQRIHASLGPNELITNSTRQKKILPFRYRLFLFLVNFSCIKITSYSIWIYPCVHFIGKSCDIIAPDNRPSCPQCRAITCPMMHLTHLPLVPHICVSELGQHWLRQCPDAWSAPSHQLSQCWNIVNWTPWNKLQWKCRLGNGGHLSRGD